MSEHRYAVGQSVRMKRHFGVYRTDDALYQITGRLPEKDNSPQYRVRSESERHDRVVTEDGLEGVEMSLGSSNTRGV
jgi:hypothetical protein